MSREYVPGVSQTDVRHGLTRAFQYAAQRAPRPAPPGLPLHGFTDVAIADYRPTGAKICEFIYQDQLVELVRKAELTQYTQVRWLVPIIWRNPNEARKDDRLFGADIPPDLIMRVNAMKVGQRVLLDQLLHDGLLLGLSTELDRHYGLTQEGQAFLDAAKRLRVSRD